MANLVHARRRLIWTMVGFGILDIVAILLLVSPLVGSPASNREQLKNVQTEIQNKTRQVVPPEQMRARVDEARQQIDNFYTNRLPSENSAIYDVLGKLAAENGVVLSQGKYTTDETSVQDLRRVTIQASLEGNYLQEVKFINALERNQLFFLVDSVTLGEQTAGKVRLELKLETYLKGRS